MATHFAAVQDGKVIATRTAQNRHAEGTGRWAAYTHAVLRHTRTTLRTDAGESVTWSQSVISWHAGERNAAAGLRAADVGRSHYYGEGERPGVLTLWKSDANDTHRVRYFTADEAVKTDTYARAELVAVIITPKKAKIGQAVQS